MEFDEVTSTDLLNSMSQCLMAVKPERKVIDTDDRIFSIKVGGKPPRSMFYRKTIVVAADPIPEYTPEICSCEYLCTRGRATIKCLTCALYDSKGQGYYCEACFTARHPWYRVAHIFGPIYRNENIANSLRSQNHDLQMDRQRIDNYQILDSIKKNKLTLEVVADDVVVDSNLRTAARRSLDLENKMNRLRARLRADVRASGGHIDYTEVEAAVIIQKLIRGYKIRRLISRAYADRTLRVWDTTSGREYYFDKFTGVSSWTPSPLLMKRDVDDLPLMQEAVADDTKWTVKRSTRRSRSLPVHDQDDAAQVLIGFFQCISARAIVVKRASEIYRRVYDDDFQTYFYVNLSNGESSWDKPKVFLTSEPSLYLTDDQNKRSPRLNREKLSVLEIR